jgi:sugar-phosphatase
LQHLVQPGWQAKRTPYHRVFYPWLVESKQILASALLFDMDGTLVDSNATVERAWAFWARRYGLDLIEVLAFSHGRPTLATMSHFGERFAPGRDWQAEADELQQMEQKEVGATVPIAGAREVLAQMHGQSKWAVVTSAPRHLAELRITAAGLPLPGVLVPADEITRGKPHPEGFLKAARLLNVRAEECLVFEDTPAGVDAGLNAGMKVIGLLTTVAPERLNTPYRIRNYHDVRVQQTDGLFVIDVLSS